MCEKCERIKAELAGKGIGFNVSSVTVDLGKGIMDFGDMPKEMKSRAIICILDDIKDMPTEKQTKAFKALKPHLDKRLMAIVTKAMIENVQEDLEKDGYYVVDLDCPEGAFVDEIMAHFREKVEVFDNPAAKEVLLFSTAAGRGDFLEHLHEKEAMMVKILSEMRTLRLLIEASCATSTLK